MWRRLERLARRIRKIGRKLLFALTTPMRVRLNGSDYRRWSRWSELSPSWDARTRMLAGLVPTGCRVVEFGAGRLVMRDCLHPDCSYTPSDLVSRSEDTLVCDLNERPLPILDEYDVAVFSGVLEYVNKVADLVEHLAKYVDTVVFSYALRECNVGNRRAQGWVNDYSEEELLSAFASVGYVCDHKSTWRRHGIYRFRKTAMTTNAATDEPIGRQV